MTEEQTRTLLGLGGKLIGSLPGQFLCLLVLNVLVVGGMFWLEDERNTAREHVLIELIRSCEHPEPHA